MLAAIQYIFQAFMITFGQFSIGVLDSQDGFQIKVSFLSFSAYLVVFILFVVIIVKKKNKYRNLYEATKLKSKK